MITVEHRIGCPDCRVHVTVEVEWEYNHPRTEDNGRGCWTIVEGDVLCACGAEITAQINDDYDAVERRIDDLRDVA